MPLVSTTEFAELVATAKPFPVAHVIVILAWRFWSTQSFSVQADHPLVVLTYPVNVIGNPSALVAKEPSLINPRSCSLLPLSVVSASSGTVKLPPEMYKIVIGPVTVTL